MQAGERRIKKISVRQGRRTLWATNTSQRLTRPVNFPLPAPRPPAAPRRRLRPQPREQTAAKGPTTRPAAASARGRTAGDGRDAPPPTNVFPGRGHGVFSSAPRPAPDQPPCPWRSVARRIFPPQVRGRRRPGFERTRPRRPVSPRRVAWVSAHSAPLTPPGPPSSRRIRRPRDSPESASRSPRPDRSARPPYAA